MEKHLFSITFMLNCFVLILSFTGVISAPVQMITDIMKNDAKLCNATKFLYDSKYTKLCTALEYPTASLNFTPATVNNFLCLGVYDAAYKICEYSSRLETSFNSTASFNSYIESLVGDYQEQFCKNLEGLTLYNKTRSYLEPLIKNLNKPYKCKKICFYFDDNLRELCAVLGWIRSIENNIEKSNHNFIVSTHQSISQYSGLHNKTPGGNEALKDKGIQESTGKQTTTDLNANINKQIMQNRSYNESSMNIKSNTERKTYNFDESDKDKTQKTMNNTPMKASKENIIDKKTKLNVEAAQSNKNIPASNEVPSKNNAGNNVPSNDNVNEGKSENLKKKQNIDDAKTSTLSENTQDYDTNVEDEMENGAINDMTDVDDTVQQPIGNENVPEAFEKNNLRFSNLRTEDESHFFTYFTVIAAMCIIGYIGYCNKQKIFAIVLEGRRSKNNRGRRRPSTASYRKLDCTLEEAVTSQCNANVTHVIY